MCDAIPWSTRVVGNRTLAMTHTGSSPLSNLEPSHLRNKLSGRWLYLLGDSSGRGLWLSLYQQLMAACDHMDLKVWLGPSLASANGRINFKDLAWADVVMDSAGNPVAVESRVESGHHTWGSPAIDASNAQPSAAAWAAGRQAGHIRLSYRFVGLTKFIQEDPFTELRQSTDGVAPNFHILQAGSWEHANFTTPELYAERLRDAIRAWIQTAASAQRTRPRPTRLAFVTMPVAYHEG